MDVPNKILAGKSKTHDNGVSEWVGKTTDVTDEAIAAVFKWLVNEYEKAAESVPLLSAHEITYPSSPYVVRISRKDEDKT
jgi:hypothetical protein